MRKLLGAALVLVLLTGCMSFDGDARVNFEREQAADAELLALQNRLEAVPGVYTATVDIRPSQLDGDPAADDRIEVRVTMRTVDLERFVDVGAFARAAVESGPLATTDHQVIIVAEGREALRLNRFPDTDEQLLEALEYWQKVRALVDPALSLTFDVGGFGAVFSRIITAPEDTPRITAEYTAAFAEISAIPDATVGMPIVDLTGLRLIGELPPGAVMETFGRVIPNIKLFVPMNESRHIGHVSLEWHSSPNDRTGAVYTVSAMQDLRGGEEDLVDVARELAASAGGPTSLQSYLPEHEGSLRFACESSQAFGESIELVEWLAKQGVPVTVADNAGFCSLPDS
ncbi:hypothetical protein EYE40_11380 [Glaciihabitans arcticus]|uniref:GerMN domain-containing protein n=1 Tax=Glaciihabitans arcticus TaxID=2668039 RepID=A0A4Q9GTA7_9MICO|nr:hypothetical protein [Glaciihabitans arcticus]TBN57951.1 hypothetical protein EYE40_11380 [Glaciihabitans arcticus]